MSTLPVIEQDAWLKPSEAQIEKRYVRFTAELKHIVDECGSIVDFANGYLYFGFQRDEDLKGWWFRDWLPAADEVYLFGDFNNWQREQLPLERGEGGVWTVFLPDALYSQTLTHGSLVKMLVRKEGRSQERIPAYIRRAVQNEETKNFTGQFWSPSQRFDWAGDNFSIGNEGLLIYEAHVGMAQESEGVGTYAEFTENILPRIKSAGYNAVQLMGIAEHPYYGSFGYHVSNFFAPSSRFSTPEELKTLVRTAHGMGLAVIMDIVHSHYVKNVNEGLNQLDGSDCHYSVAGNGGDHPYWDSKLFDYGKNEVRHFLLSNVRYWMEEFHFDGFRFDGVTSMIYKHHGYTEFDDREKYFNDDVNGEALCYLTLANHLVHELNPRAVTIAEDVSGMPTMCSPTTDGGVGFDYRLGMAIPDFWIRMIEDVPDEEWNIWEIWEVLTNRLPHVKTIAYAESHDQALVGDKTIAFRLMDKSMYYDMDRSSKSFIIDRGVALHKMIRLATVAMGGQGYMNFMGNEFGHPDWIDFPREGNDWSYAYARRQWSLADNLLLRYSVLGRFDRVMIQLVKQHGILNSGYPYRLKMDAEQQTMVFCHGELVFVFNWHTEDSVPDYEIPVPYPGRYRVVLSTDDENFGGFGRDDQQVVHFSFPAVDGDSVQHRIKIYNLCRSAVVLKRDEEE